MNEALSAILILQCFLGPAPGGDVAVIKVPIPAEMSESFRDGTPPESRNIYIGEEVPVREWAFGHTKDASAKSFKVLRVGASKSILSPGSYSARFGMMTPDENAHFKFADEMTGYCNLNSGVDAPEEALK